jgi:hypothetical protein
VYLRSLQLFCCWRVWFCSGWSSGCVYRCLEAFWAPHGVSNTGLGQILFAALVLKRKREVNEISGTWVCVGAKKTIEHKSEVKTTTHLVKSSKLIVSCACCHAQPAKKMKYSLGHQLHLFCSSLLVDFFVCFALFLPVGQDWALRRHHVLADSCLIIIIIDHPR